MTEKEKMIAGEMYNPSDEILTAERHQARLLFQEMNGLNEDSVDKRNELLNTLINNAGQKLYVEPPFYCDYGYNIIAGDNVFMNGCRNYLGIKSEARGSIQKSCIYHYRAWKLWT